MAMTPIEVEVLRNAMNSIADEAYISLMKSAYSTNIKERRDHSTAIFDAGGRVIVQGESMPLHLASMLGLVEVVLEKYDLGDIAPGDLFISNDPFVGRGSHLPDVAMIMPVFSGRELVLFVSNIAHHADIGGMAPGSMADGMTEIYQEGIRIPPIRLFRRGELQSDVMDLILLNVRVPQERRGDYNAQIAANRLAARRCDQLVDKWTAPVIREGCQRIVEAVEKRIGVSVAALPDVEHRFRDILDDDGMGTEGIEIRVGVEISGERIRFDFDDTAPQVRGNINVTMAGLQACCLYAMKVLVDPECPQNHGMLAPIEIHAPEGAIVNARFPAASAARAQTGQRIADAIFGALAGALPDRVIAPGNGANTAASFFGRGPDGRWYCRYAVSYRDLESMMTERGVAVDHSTIYRWVQRFAPEMEKRLRWQWRRPRSSSWRVELRPTSRSAASGRICTARPTSSATRLISTSRRPQRSPHFLH